MLRTMNSLRMSFWMVPESCSCGDALLLGRDDVAGQHRQHGAVHGHRHRDPVERDAVEQDLHVLDRVDGHAGLAHVAGHARMVGVVAAVGGQVEGHRDALAAAGQRALVEGVGFLGGGEAGVLADGPRPHRVHGGLRAAHERLEAGQGVGVGQAVHVALRVQRLDGDALGSDPVEGGHVAPADFAAAFFQASRSEEFGSFSVMAATRVQGAARAARIVSAGSVRGTAGLTRATIIPPTPGNQRSGRPPGEGS